MYCLQKNSSEIEVHEYKTHEEIECSMRLPIGCAPSESYWTTVAEMNLYDPCLHYFAFGCCCYYSASCYSYFLSLAAIVRPVPSGCRRRRSKGRVDKKTIIELTKLSETLLLN